MSVTVESGQNPDVAVDAPTPLRRLLAAEPMIPTRQAALWVDHVWRRFEPETVEREIGLLQWRALAVAPFGLVVADFALRVVGAGSSWRGLCWGSINAALIGAILVTALWAWERVKGVVDGIDGLFLPFVGPRANQRELEYAAYIAGVGRRLALNRLHVLACLGCAAVAVIGTAAAARHLPLGTLGPAYYVNVAVLGFVGADSIRWMVRVPLILVRPLTEASDLRVIMHAPANTRGIRDMARLAAGTALRASIGLFILGLVLMWEVLSARLSHGPGISHVEWLALIDLGPLVISAAVVIYVTFVPQMWLSDIVGRQRDRIIDRLAAQLPADDPLELATEAAERQTKLYDSIASVSTDTGTVRVIVRRVLAVVAVLLPQLVAVGAKLLHLD